MSVVQIGWADAGTKKAKRASGLKISEHGANTEHHFAKLRVTARNLVVQDQPNRGPIPKSTSFVSFKHAQSDYLQSELIHAALGTEGDFIHSSTRFSPAFWKDQTSQQSKTDSPIESLDTKRAQIIAMDAKNLAGLDIASRKRRSHAFISSSSPGLPTEADTCVECIEDMLSFGSPNDEQGMQATTDQSTEEAQNERMADIPPTLYEDALRVATQTLITRHSTGSSIQRIPEYHPMQPSEDDSQARIFNLFAPAQVNVLDGNTTDPEPKMAPSFQDQRNPRTRLSDAPGKGHGLDIGNQIIPSLMRDRQGRNHSLKRDGSSDSPSKVHGKPSLKTPEGTNSLNSPQTRPAGKFHSNSGSGTMSSSPLDKYALRSHPIHRRHTSGLIPLSPGYSNSHGKLANRDLAAATKRTPNLDNCYVSFNFASAESTPSPSQEPDSPLTTEEGSRRKIGLRLFDDYP
ncbi:hypothetical protein RhiXN_02823 [Rhizoctonia solani]|uniref:Uncharacterized protein n=1 Tax=Rhizoctonia solani TaxID=456999 RepID=A0A8H8NQ88_9AGAM|nr:uncharacterized protein RhiXN_02823 [Rhizoctonia solani]QRW17899.1 hypothetical protein RhiXN_02823 [Rhizoctonia solani]